MDFVRPTYLQGGKIILVEFDYTLKMFQRKGTSTLLGKHPTGIRRGRLAAYFDFDWGDGYRCAISPCNLNYATENVALQVQFYALLKEQSFRYIEARLSFTRRLLITSTAKKCEPIAGGPHSHNQD